MSKYCPVLERKVLYLECNECEEKLCRNISKSHVNSNNCKKLEDVKNE